MRTPSFLVLQIVLVSCLPGFVSSQNISHLDSLIMRRTNLVEYAWFADYSAESIFMCRDTNLYRHQYRQHLLVHNAYGTYETMDDELILTCIYNCDLSKAQIYFGPIVVPMNDNRFKDTVFIQRADGSRKDLSATLIRNAETNTDFIHISDGSESYTETHQPSSSYYMVNVDAAFKPYLSSNDMKKYGIIRNDSMLLDDKYFKYHDYSIQLDSMVYEQIDSIIALKNSEIYTLDTIYRSSVNEITIRYTSNSKHGGPTFRVKLYQFFHPKRKTQPKYPPPKYRTWTFIVDESSNEILNYRSKNWKQRSRATF